MTVQTIAVTLLTLLLSACVYGLYVGYLHRAGINRLRKQGMRMPAEWNWFTGHLLVLQKYVDRLPSDVNVNLAVRDLALEEFADTEVFLMDYWPIQRPLLIVFNPETATQVTTKYNLPKTSMHLKFMQPITGGPTLHSMGDEEWKIWRALFNPGFSSASMADQVPGILDSVQIFCEKLRENASSGALCFLDNLTTRLTMDVILKVTLGTNLDYQRSDNILATALNTIIAWHSFWDPRVLLNPIRPFVQKYYGYLANKYIKDELNERFTEMQQTWSESPDLLPTHKKSVISLALEAYMQSQHGDNKRVEKLDKHFSDIASYQIRLFLFAGTDTTSSSIVYVYHLLSKHPDVLARVRQEHDAVFGTDPSAADGLLRKNPALLNKCTYTMAVIKETLRLFVPAATMRGGRRGVSVTDRQGGTYVMDNIGTLVLHPAVHMNPRVWPRPAEFLPERWLVDSDHELYPNPNAYRPFEQGPRNCIGQTLVYNEMRIVMVMTLRTFKLTPAYEEWDAMQLKNQNVLKKLARRVGIAKEPLKTVDGERAYQTDRAGTHPADGYPCSISFI